MPEICKYAMCCVRACSLIYIRNTNAYHTSIIRMILKLEIMRRTIKRKEFINKKRIKFVSTTCV